jgi:hypothetical protein
MEMTTDPDAWKQETPFSIIGDPYFTNPRLEMRPEDYAPDPWPEYTASDFYEPDDDGDEDDDE